MLNNSFYSNSNINILKSIISDDTKIQINKNHELIISETMKYVEKNAGLKPPPNMSDKEYLFLLNKKVYEIVVPVISKNNNKDENLNKNTSSRSQQQHQKQQIKQQYDPQDILSQKVIDSVFDPQLVKGYETINVIDYPRPNFEKDKKLDEKMKSFEEERSTMLPKKQDINFKIDTTEFENKNNKSTSEMYQELLNSYKKQVQSSDDFESSQKKMNNIINKFEENDTKRHNESANIMTNITKLSPVNILNDRLLPNQPITSQQSINGQNSYEDALNARVQMMSEPKPYYPEKQTERQQTIIEPTPFENIDRTTKLTSVILEKPVTEVLKKVFLIFDSKDRNLELYPLPNAFQVKFSPDGSVFKYDNIYDSNGTLIIREKNIIYGDSSNVSIGQTFDNIKNIKCVSTTVPTFPQFYGGKGPTLYTSPQSTTTNVVQDANVSNYNPRYTPETGVFKTIFSEPYLLLAIPQLRGPYKGNNIFNKTFAKLSVQYSDNNNLNPYNTAFTTLRTDETNENFDYSIVSLGKLDKLDLVLENKDAIPYNFGIDKLFVESVSEGNVKYNGYCGSSYKTTILTIQQTNPSYSSYCKTYNFIGDCTTLNSHPVSPGDVIYLYDTKPNSDQIAYFENNIYIKSMTYNPNNIIIDIAYNNSSGQQIDIDMTNVIPGGVLMSSKLFTQYYFIIVDNSGGSYNVYYLNIIGFTIDGIGVIVNNPPGTPVFTDYSKLKIGIARANMAGTNNDLLSSILFKGGINVITVGTPSTNNYNDISNNYWEIEIDYPYESISDNFILSPGEIFFIQKKMQITYNFEIQYATKDYNNLISRLNEYPNS